jgi:esterase/lipase
MAQHLFNDEILSLDCDRKTYTKTLHIETNVKETATASPDPFLIVPEVKRQVGILLVHGLLASPAEMYAFGRELSEEGYVTLGVRLKGHGTSPWDLRERHWQDWSASILRGRKILSAYVDEIVIVGFGTGGTLSLLTAATDLVNVVGVVAVSVPWKFKTPNLLLAHLAKGYEKLTSWIPAMEERAIFREHPSENPDVNYHSVPVRTAYELHKLREELHEKLPDVRCPVLLLQGTKDPIVDAKGINKVFELVGTDSKDLVMIESEKHGILYHDIGECRDRVRGFISDLKKDKKAEMVEGVVSIGYATTSEVS